MLAPEPFASKDLIPLGDAERAFFEKYVPPEHFLRRLPQAVDFEAFRATLASCYHEVLGRKAIDPVLMLKLEVLGYQYTLSDREVMSDCCFNIAYRLFLGLSLDSPLPHHTSLTYFRRRLGEKRLRQIFDTLLDHARQLGLVKDRLRLKDATHIIANMAVPSTIRLVGQARDQVLDALRPLAPERTLEEEQRAEAIRIGSENAKDAERLLQRVRHLRALLAWADEVPAQAIFKQQNEATQQQLLSALAVAHKILADRDHPKAGDKTLSIHDPDARRGMHGGYYEGYLLDVAMDADSELITGVNVLPANGDEGADAAQLIRQEEQAHGNDVAAVSIDGAGFRGPVLRELTDPDGLNLEVFTPPSPEQSTRGFAAERFSLTMVDGRETLTCPAGQTTSARQRNAHDTGYRYSFKAAQCSSCSMRQQCLDQANAKRRVVSKNDYEADYAAARAKAQSPEYAAVRSQHAAIERKLSELIRRHDVRHARYRGRLKVLFQGLMTALVVNMKRLARLCLGPPEATARMVRAGLVAGG
jgi:transposase